MKSSGKAQMAVRQGISVACLVLLTLFPPYGASVFGQNSAPPPPSQIPAQPQAATPPMTPDQLDDLVAPIALYPDPLLGQVLAASTYPLEVVEAQQWLQQNGNLHGTQLIDAAKQQNWDPSVQALVAFPDVLTTLNRDVQWMTDLGNAFLAQQNDVMAAVQRLRLRAQQNGKLSSTQQQTVTTQAQDGQNTIVIEPASPQVIYVPVYNPEYVWGPPAWGYYPPLWYPGISFGFGFGPGIFMGGFFPGWGGFGWGGWGVGWGWGCGWGGGGLFVNGGFFNRYGFRGGYYGGGYGGGFGRGGFAGGRGAWQHDPFHRAGVGYGNRAVAARFNNSRFAAGRFNAGRMSTGVVNGGRSFAGGGARGGAGAAGGFNGGAARGGVGGARGGVGGARGGVGTGATGGARGYNNAGTTANRGFSPANRAGAGTAGNVNRGYAGTNTNRTYGGTTQSYGRNYSTQASRGYGGTGYSGAARGYSAPQNYGAARSYGGGYGAGRSYAGSGYSTGRSYGGGGYSAGRSFGGGGYSGGRSFGGGGGFSGGRSFGGGGGGHSFGGGGHGGGGRR